MNEPTDFADMTKFALETDDISSSLPSVRDVKHLEYMAIENIDLDSIFRIIKIYKEHPAVNRLRSTEEKSHAINLISRAYFKLRDIYD